MTGIENTGTAASTGVQPDAGSVDATQASDFMQSIYTKVSTNRQVHSEKYVELIVELNNVNNKAEMLNRFADAVAAYDGDGSAADFEQQVLAPFREENPGFDDAFDVSDFRYEEGYDLRRMQDGLTEVQNSINNISSQKQLEINQAGMARDHYTAFIAKFIQDLHGLLQRLLN
ncbi:MAG: hypothetical protein OXC81_07085 [Betaproteobacteria bacterium]|nr:hypothetical protein [Betaproteobacteria bacterium]